ncbi:MAG: aminotransferase class V-fold PLP-dependent enzyme, partial [Planctomycetes bacterium]|nr:aminotransferase class V-fold PLP-dependent enzyme [Planctomycetota bacterium]
TYLDNNATTKPLDEVVDAMLPFLRSSYANPSSVHQFGQSVRHSVECARGQVAALIGADPKEIVFTSSGTESIQLALRGVLAFRKPRRRIVISRVQHSAVRTLSAQLAREGFEIIEIGVDRNGLLDVDELAASLTDDTAVVSLMWANNETGAVFDIERIAEIVAAKDVPFHVDAVQAVGKIPLDLSDVPITLLSLSTHKFHGPKGVGALFVRRRTRLAPLILGSQESQRRGGTENVAGIIGMGVAAEHSRTLVNGEVTRIRELRDRLEHGICSAIDIAQVNSCDALRICNTTNIGFRGLQAEALLLLLSESGVCASAGSACSSGSLEPSHVLQAMGVEPEYAHGSIRFSLSRFTTRDEVDRVIDLMPSLVARLAALGAR